MRINAQSLVRMMLALACGLLPGKALASALALPPAYSAQEKVDLAVGEADAVIAGICTGHRTVHVNPAHTPFGEVYDLLTVVYVTPTQWFKGPRADSTIGIVWPEDLAPPDMATGANKTYSNAKVVLSLKANSRNLIGLDAEVGSTLHYELGFLMSINGNNCGPWSRISEPLAPLIQDACNADALEGHLARDNVAVIGRALGDPFPCKSQGGKVDLCQRLLIREELTSRGVGDTLIVHNLRTRIADTETVLVFGTWGENAIRPSRPFLDLKPISGERVVGFTGSLAQMKLRLHSQTEAPGSR